MKKFGKSVMAMGMVFVMMLAMVGCGDKDETKKAKKETTIVENTQNSTIPRPELSENQINTYENIVYVSMMDGKWKEDPSYVYKMSDFKTFFNEVNEQNVFYQLLLSKGLWTGEGEKYVGSNGATYDFLADSTRYSNFLHTMYGVDFDFYSKLATEDLAISQLYYDANTDSVYMFDGMLPDMSCHYEGAEALEDLSINVRFTVSNELDDGTPFKGEIVLNLALVEDAYGDYSLTSVSFTPAK
ncbi:MAG: hypothetical protein KBT07_00605 [Clostridiales bacterium]|nr:hypothetical protein [Candidatus Scatonaster coprocaballi]